jgi:hypothetical protein
LLLLLLLLQSKPEKGIFRLIVGIRRRSTGPLSFLSLSAFAVPPMAATSAVTPSPSTLFRLIAVVAAFSLATPAAVVFNGHRRRRRLLLCLIRRFRAKKKRNGHGGSLSAYFAAAGDKVQSAGGLQKHCQ